MKTSPRNSGMKLKQSLQVRKMIGGYQLSLKLGTGSHKFGRKSYMAETVLILPHSNVSEESVFSVIMKNKTSFQHSLKVDGTLTSLLTIKMANKESSFETPADFVDQCWESYREIKQRPSATKVTAWRRSFCFSALWWQCYFSVDCWMSQLQVKML